LPPVNSTAYDETATRDVTRAIDLPAGQSRGDLITYASASLLVGLTAVGLWLASGVRIDEIARFVPYEFTFVVLPGWLMYRAVMARPGGLLRQIAFGWSLGYLLEVLAFFVTASVGVRSLFLLHPVIVGVPAAIVVWKRRARDAAKASANGANGPFAAPVWIGAAFCVVLLGYTAAVGFAQNPLPRDITSATYQEDTVFAISIAAEALHHWPVTLPMVSGEPLHYHLFAFMHMAAVSQVTGIDLSVVVLRLYEVPLLVLLVLQLILAGRRIGRKLSVGLAATAVVLFLGELDVSTSRAWFYFNDFFFYWLLGSHSLLLGLVFFVPAIVIVSDLLTGERANGRRRVGMWLLFAAFIVGCLGAKSYALFDVAGGLGVFLVWQGLRERKVNRAAFLALVLCGLSYVVANVLVFRWNTAGAVVSPFETLIKTEGVGELTGNLGRLWGESSAPSAFGVPYGIVGLIGIPILGICLRLARRRVALATAEVWFLSIFVGGLLPLFILNQPGYGQLFLVFFGVVAGSIVAANGYTLFWKDARPSLRVALVTLVSGAALVVGLDLLVDVPPRVGGLATLCWLLIVIGGSALAGLSRRFVAPAAAAVAVLGLLLMTTPAVAFLRGGWNAIVGDPVHGPPRFWASLAASLLVLVVLSLAAFYFVRRPSSRQGLAAAVVAGCLGFAVLNTPLDWFPRLVDRTAAGEPVYNQELSGLTKGLYDGLVWIRENTETNAVLAVNNHSLYPDNRDSKYFYYSAFAQRRVVLESWDYTAQTTALGLFSLDAAHTPFFRQLTLSNGVFRMGDDNALYALAHDYGADYLVVDKVHRPASPLLAAKLQSVYSNGDIDIYAVGNPPIPTKPSPSSGGTADLCTAEQGAGITAVLGHRPTLDAAFALRDLAYGSGFQALSIQRRGCHDYAVVLSHLDSLAQARDFQKEAATVYFDVTIECRTQAARGGLNAVFGHRRTRRAAEELASRANAVGFTGLEVRQDACGDWEVDLPGLETAAQRLEFRREAASVGFRIVFEPG
jgi:hypothetical protein